MKSNIILLALKIIVCHFELLNIKFSKVYLGVFFPLLVPLLSIAYVISNY